MKLWTFKPLDSCFFRGAMPFNAGEGGYLDSMFPPTMQTLSGAFRYAVAVPLEGNRGRLEKVVGESGDDPGVFSFFGPYVFKNGNRLYPAPLHLLYKMKRLEKNHLGLVTRADYEWARLSPGKSVRCDLGDVRLPQFPEKEGNMEGGKSPEGVWLDQANLEGVLRGEQPRYAHSQDELFTGETRTGIARDNEKRTVEPGMLYYTRHIRLRDNISFGLGVITEPDDEYSPESATVVRLGGEGRVARLGEFDDSAGHLPGKPDVQNGEQRLILTLLTHGDFGGESEPDWSDKRLSGLELVSACIGKAIREGGWDYKAKAPKPLRSLVPAGSSYFVKVGGELKAAIDALHGEKIGKRTKFGYGEIVVGLWR